MRIEHDDQPATTSISSFVNKSVAHSDLNRFLKTFLGPYFAVLLIFIAIGGWHQIGFHEGFNIGDWLINYQGGFVRRGLIGEGLYVLALMTGVSPAVLLVGLQTILFSIYFYFSYRILTEKSDLLKYAVLIASPFLFTFAINSQAGGYRKEILYFAILSFVTYAQKSYTPQSFQRMFVWVLFLYPFVLLSDELGLVVLPVLVGIYWNRIRNPTSKTFLWIACALSINVATFLFILLHHRISTDQVQAIINALIRTGYDPKGTGGAIGALSQTTLSNTKDTFSSIVHAHYFLIYPLAFALCAVAYLPLAKDIRKIVRNKYLIYGFSGSAILLMPVFVIANDWGRWLYILLVELFMLILVVDDEKTPETEDSHTRYSTKHVLLGSLFLLSYAVFWYLPHVLENGSDWHAVFHNVPLIER